MTDISFTSWLGMLIRAAVAAIDFNANINRGVKKDAQGQVMFKTKVRIYLINGLSTVLIGLNKDVGNEI